MGVGISIHIIEVLSQLIENLSKCYYSFEVNRRLQFVTASDAQLIRAYPTWKELLSKCKNIEDWTMIINDMFEDKVVTIERLKVFNIYTLDVMESMEIEEERQSMKEAYLLKDADLRKMLHKQ